MGNSNIVKRMARIAIFSAILVAQEEALSFIPNVQFTQCLIAIYLFSFGLVDTLVIVTIHTLIDNLIWGSLNPIYTPAMLLGWMSLVLILFIFRKIKNKTIISIIVALHSIIYALMFSIPAVYLNGINFATYITSDIPFTAIMIVNGFVTTYLLFDRLTNAFSKLDNKLYINKK